MLTDTADVVIAPRVEEVQGLWLVLRVWGGKEHAVADAIAGTGIGFYLPCVKQTRVYAKRKVVADVPVFKGYVFAATAHDGELYDLRGLRYVIDHQAVPSYQQAKLVRQLASLQLTLDHDPYLDASDWRQEGVPVRVKSGPLATVEGRIVKRRGHDVLLVGVHILGREVEIDIDAKDLEPI